MKKLKEYLKFLLIFGVIMIVVSSLVAYIYIWMPQQQRAAFENYYLNIMKNLNSSETKTELRSKFYRDYNFTELYEWVHEKLEFVPSNENIQFRYADPFCILGYGKGRCGEFSILYVAACLAHGYQSRIVVAVNVSNPYLLNETHAWAEVKLDGWVHVDPSDKVWNKPYRYKGFRVWGKDIGSDIRIYAFEDGKCEDVTSTYS